MSELLLAGFLADSESEQSQAEQRQGGRFGDNLQAEIPSAVSNTLVDYGQLLREREGKEKAGAPNGRTAEWRTADDGGRGKLSVWAKGALAGSAQVE